MILIPEHDLEMGSRSRRLRPVKLLPPPLPPGAAGFGICSDADMRLLQDGREQRSFW